MTLDQICSSIEAEFPEHKNFVFDIPENTIYAYDDNGKIRASFTVKGITRNQNGMPMFVIDMLDYKNKLEENNENSY